MNSNPNLGLTFFCSRPNTWGNVTPDFFANMQYVVLDEAHYYRGGFGTHLACILRRLRRLAYKYGSSPRFVLCSATATDASELACKLVGLAASDVQEIAQDGSGSSEKTVLLLNPSKVQPAR